MKKCVLCGKELDSIYLMGKRAGTVGIYGGKDTTYCSRECYIKAEEKNYEKM